MGTKDTQIIARLCMGGLAPYPGLSVPVFVACSSNTEENLSLTVTYLDVVWMCGGVAHSICTVVEWHSEPRKCHQDCLMSTAQPLCGPWLQSVVHSLVIYLRMCHSSTRPHRYLIVCDEFYPSSLSKGLTNQMTLL